MNQEIKTMSFPKPMTASNVILLSVLALLPNIFGMINIPLVYGFKIHFFQLFLFVAAGAYGPIGGMIAGGFGSMYTASALSNPYILIGNMMLGILTGILMRRGWKTPLAVFVVLLIQLPYVWLSDVFLAGMPRPVVWRIVTALFVTDMIWAFTAFPIISRLKTRLFTADDSK